jgi:hypothetical protein
MSAHDYNALKNHIGHAIECVSYGDTEHTANVALECLDCNEVLMDYDNPGTEKIQEAPVYNLKDFRVSLDEQIETVLDLDLGNVSDNEKLVRARAYILKDLLNNDNFWTIVNDLLEDYNDIPEEDNLKEEAFFAAGNFIENPEKEGSGEPDKFMWDGVFATQEYTNMFLRCDLEDNDPNKLYIYSLTEEDGEGYVQEGKRYVNRIGYFFSTIKVELPEGFRYW